MRNVEIVYILNINKLSFLKNWGEQVKRECFVGYKALALIF